MNTDIIEISKQAAEVLGVPAYIERDFGNYVGKSKWLADDVKRCAEIAANKRIGTIYYQDDFVIATWIDIDGDYRKTTVLLADHNNNRLKAYCVAVCRAVMEQEKQYRCCLHSL